MVTNWFVVIKVLDQWWIDNEGASFGPFSTKEAACAISSRIAANFGDKKRRSLVFWPDETGKQRLMFEL